MGLGLALGLAGAFGLSRVLRTLLVQVTPTDPVTFVTITDDPDRASRSPPA